MSGRLTSEDTRRIGSGYICSAGQPTADATVRPTRSRPFPTSAPRELLGGCDLVPVAAQPGAAFFRCTLRPVPDPGNGLVGGIAVSNSLVNAAGAGTGTASVWTSHLVFSRRVDGLAPRGRAPRPSSHGATSPSAATGSTSSSARPGPAAAPGGRQCRPLGLRSYQPRISTSFTDVPRSGDRVAGLALCRAGEVWRATERCATAPDG